MAGFTREASNTETVRSERDRWQVPESDPAGRSPDPNRGTGGSIDLPRPGDSDSPVRSAERAPLIYCGQCAALNPATNHYCAACGATLVDAFHASEGLRVYERPDTASRMIEIIAAGSELDLVDDPDAGTDFLRVKMTQGRLGYIRLADVEAMANALPDAAPALGRSPDINTNAVGCITQTSALGALALFLVFGALALVYATQTDASESGIVALAACVTIGPLIAVTIGLYVYARSRDERLRAEDEEPAGLE